MFTAQLSADQQLRSKAAVVRIWLPKGALPNMEP
jgi:hypothetical protein